MSSKRWDKLREAALAKDWALTPEERQKAAKEFKRLNRRAMRTRTRGGK